MVWNYYEEGGRKPHKDQHGILRFFKLAEISLAAGSIDPVQISPSPDDFNNRVRVIDFDVAATRYLHPDLCLVQNYNLTYSLTDSWV